MSGIKIFNHETVTRQTIPNDPRDSNLFKVSSGYDFPPDEIYELPPCGLYDADEAVKLLFQKYIGFDTKEIYSKNQMVKIDSPQVFFAGGDRFALSKRKVPPLDKSRMPILPSIAIMKKDISFALEEQKRGITDKMGNIMVKRALSKDDDRAYQNYLNKIALRNIDVIPSVGTSGEDGIHSAKNDAAIKDGALLQPTLLNNAYEVLSIPIPKPFISTYEITFWTRHMAHMNYMIETMYSSMLTQEKAFKFVTSGGYWFLGHFEDQAINGSNFEDYMEEKIIQFNFTIKVKGFIVPPQRGNNANPVRKWIFMPRLDLDVIDTKKIPMQTERLMQQDSIKQQIQMVPNNTDGLLPMFSLDGEIDVDEENAQKKEFEEKILYEQTIQTEVGKQVLYLTEKQISGEKITTFKTKDDWEKLKFSANEARKARRKL